MSRGPVNVRSWLRPQPHLIDSAVLDACDQDAFLAGILIERGYQTPDRIRRFLDLNAYIPAPPDQIPDLAHGSNLLHQAIDAQKRILIWGDFDVDGQTATSLLMDGLRRLGADVVYYLPKRATESHGIKPDSLARQLDDLKPDVLLTCDTGVTEFEAIDLARARGVKVIVTDHHDLDERLPDADAVINPKRLAASPYGQPDHPLIALPGVGVAYKLMQHLFTTRGQDRELPRLLDLVALGIVSDVAVQVDDTRYLLQVGLERLRRAERPGLRALIEVCGLSPESLTAENIGFQIGPRLNAVGRLGDAALAVELLTTRDMSRARIIAQTMDGLNNDRKLFTRQIESAAEELIKRDRTLLDHGALVIYRPSWQAGVLGIVANRLSERYHRPTILLSGEEGSQIAAGSARAPTGYNLHAALTANAELLRTFGGHMGAAGLSLRVDQIDLLRVRLTQSLAAPEPPPLRIDAALPFKRLELRLLRSLDRLAPFGEGNPIPLLMTTSVKAAQVSEIGRDKRHLKLILEDEHGDQQTVLWWESKRDQVPDGRFDVAYTLGKSDRGELQVTFVDLHTLTPQVAAPPKPTLAIHDLRDSIDPARDLAALRAKLPGAPVWAEAYSRRDYPDWKRRAQLEPAHDLIIFTAPGDPQTLESALRKVEPAAVYVFGLESPIQSFEAFMKQLSLAARNGIDQAGGTVALDVLCGATAGSASAVRAGLAFLAADGQIGLSWTDGDAATLSPGNGVSGDAAQVRALFEKVHRAYAEMEAYRRFFRGASLRQILRWE